MVRFLTFRLERLLQRGAAWQLLLIAALVGLVALVGGILAFATGAGFANLGEATWWAFLRLTDPGYLGDDEGSALRVVSTIVTVLGYVLFMGSLIAILTQWLSRTLRTLEQGLTPIAIRDHLLVLGWTNRTPGIVAELVRARGRMQRFLRRRGVRTLRIVILAQEVGPELTAELKAELGDAWNPRQLVLRSGSSLNVEHLRRVNALEAAAIVVPGADYVLGGARMTDARIVKTLMSLTSFADGADCTELPPVVAEIVDAAKAPIAERAYRGRVDLIASDVLIARLIAQNVRHRGLSHVYNELLAHAYGNAVYVREVPGLTGRPWHRVAGAFPGAVPLGVVRPRAGAYLPLLNPAPDLALEADDRVAFIARSFEATAPGALPGGDPPVLDPSPPAAPPRERRLLLLGWSHKVAALVREFDQHGLERNGGERIRIDLMSLVPAAERAAAAARWQPQPTRVELRQLEGDYTLLADLAPLEPARYDTVIFVGSDWLESDEASDARTVLGHALLRSLLPEGADAPGVLVELMDPDNDRLFTREEGEIILSPVLLSHMLAHTALRPELRAIFDALFGPGGSDIAFRPAADYGLAGRSVDVAEARALALRRREVFLGFRTAAPAGGRGGGLHLNPASDRPWPLSAADDLVVLATTGDAAGASAEAPVTTAASAQGA